jgi:hypothetical protein
VLEVYILLTKQETTFCDHTQQQAKLLNLKVFWNAEIR